MIGTIGKRDAETYFKKNSDGLLLRGHSHTPEMIHRIDNQIRFSPFGCRANRRTVRQTALHRHLRRPDIRCCHDLGNRRRPPDLLFVQLEKECQCIATCSVPITINQLEIRNRIAYPSLGLLYSYDSKLNQRYTDFFRERARGGAGIVTVGSRGRGFSRFGPAGPIHCR